MKLIRHLILLILTFVVLVSSTGISVGMHLCEGELHDLSFFGADADCPMEQPQQKLPSCHNEPAPGNAASACCDDHTLLLEQADAASDSTAQLLTKSPDLRFAAAFKVVILQLFAPEAEQASAYALYKSPPIARDIPVLVQSFLL
ncbi:HYC_CC_PP family protein [Pontibacter amylolyticus]|uniref:Secreted protein n=1 Tax=Pontibacter amylolyticus TaxID=1424080 RepID=A0ABQ1W8W4_9BACT|nr:hypothetical protein [Pontibacter amylolyticus]GGG18623.1 hypothetical protein GCM10011323_23470 [Pontibacter amylolyticus]